MTESGVKVYCSFDCTNAAGGEVTANIEGEEVVLPCCEEHLLFLMHKFPAHSVGYDKEKEKRGGKMFLGLLLLALLAVIIGFTTAAKWLFIVALVLVVVGALSGRRTDL